MTKTKIFIVEDEQIVAMDLGSTLENAGFTVAGIANRGEMAIQKVQEIRPDLVLMDIGLKGELDGIDTAMQVRTRFNLPVIFLTAFADPSTLERAHQAEPYGFLIKPFEERELVITIEMALHKHSMESKLLSSENKFRSVIEHASDGIALMDRNGILVVWNTSMEQITGLNSSDVLGRSLGEITFQLTPPESRTSATLETNTRLWELSIQNEFIDADKMAEREIYTPQGLRKTIQSNGFAVETSEGLLGGVIMRDITERSRMEKELQMLSQAVEQSANMIVVTDIEGTIEYVNPKYTQISGYPLNEARSKTLGIMQSGEHSKTFHHDLWKKINNGEVWKGEFQNQRKNGELYWEEATIAPVYDLSGKMVNFVAVIEDVTTRKALEAAERDQRLLAEALRDTSMALNSTLKLDDILDHILANIGKLVKYDIAMVSLVEGNMVRKVRYSYHPGNTLNVIQLRDEQTNLFLSPLLAEIIRDKRPCLVPDIQADDRWQAVSIPELQDMRSLVCIPIAIQGNLLGVLTLISSTPNFFTALQIERIVTFASQAAVAVENARLFERTQQLALTDDLTQLYNMRYFNEFASTEFERSKRNQRALAMTMMDIDHFKKINDTHGHRVGDLVLHEIAARIKSAVRTIDITARYGGEEFIILLPDTGQAEAYQIAERVRVAVTDSPVNIRDLAISVALSLGVVELGPDIEHLDELIRRADQAMYAAKAAGRNRVAMYSPELENNPHI